MPRATLRFAESAIADLQAIKDWYTEEGVPRVGERIVEEIFSRVTALRAHPDMGRIVPEFDEPFLRELIHAPFRIVYRRDQRHVRVVRVWRGERPLPKDFGDA